MKESNLTRFYWLVVIQLVVLLVSVGVIAIVKPNGWFEFIAGGLNAIVPNAWFTFRAISQGQVRKSLLMVAMVNRGMIEKYALATSGFMLIFIVLKPNYPLLVFFGFIAMLVTQVIGMFYLRTSKPVN